MEKCCVLFGEKSAKNRNIGQRPFHLWSKIRNYNFANFEKLQFQKFVEKNEIFVRNLTFDKNILMKYRSFSEKSNFWTKDEKSILMKTRIFGNKLTFW